ncbi:hypothetical protein LXM25_05915 [Dyadobacter sp. LJ53]|uniref:hypothetical protein n=1 Tax=Dyadobacter chenwenxiniae TaxID=2906456 RepID=UPI001F1BE3C6|nr:hypothetical protein [Dyadobacter chenwenxiniae]MCF0049580.1 hypothetical protein [Dyadobacter chenwenxiniae]
MMKNYQLEIYEPHALDSWVYFESDSPFAAINKGDILAAANFPGALMTDRYRITSVEHIIWEKAGVGIRHKICVYTEKLEDTDYDKERRINY